MRIIRVSHVNGKQAGRKYPTSIKINRLRYLCDALRRNKHIMRLARSLARSDNKIASCRTARKDSSSLSKISPFPRAHKLAACNIGPLRLGGRPSEGRSETENFHGHGPDLVTHPGTMCIGSSNRGKKWDQRRGEEQPRLCRESGIDCKKETGYRIKAIPARPSDIEQPEGI